MFLDTLEKVGRRSPLVWMGGAKVVHLVVHLLVGDLWMWPATNRPQPTPTGPRTTSNCSHMSCSPKCFDKVGKTPSSCLDGRSRSLAHKLCYAIVFPGRKSGFRAAFRQDSSWERPKLGSPAGLRPAGRPIMRFYRLESGLIRPGRPPARKHYCVT